MNERASITSVLRVSGESRNEWTCLYHPGYCVWAGNRGMNERASITQRTACEWGIAQWMNVPLSPSVLRVSGESRNEWTCLYHPAYCVWVGNRAMNERASITQRTACEWGIAQWMNVPLSPSVLRVSGESRNEWTCLYHPAYCVWVGNRAMNERASITQRTACEWGIAQWMNVPLSPSVLRVSGESRNEWTCLYHPAYCVWVGNRGMNERASITQRTACERGIAQWMNVPLSPSVLRVSGESRNEWTCLYHPAYCVWVGNRAMNERASITQRTACEWGIAEWMNVPLSPSVLRVSGESRNEWTCLYHPAYCVWVGNRAMNERASIAQRTACEWGIAQWMNVPLSPSVPSKARERQHLWTLDNISN